jgi:hypothetical protein
MATLCGIEDSVMPLVGRQRLQAAQDRCATPPDGDEPDAALVQFRRMKIEREALGLGEQQGSQSADPSRE